MSRGHGAAGSGARTPEGRAAWTRGFLEGGFVWVVISGPSWEPLIIRKSNKQGNPVFHTQGWPRLRVCVFPLRLPTGLLSHTGMLGGNFPSSTLVGCFCLGSCPAGSNPLPPSLQTKIGAGLGRSLPQWGGRGGCWLCPKQTGGLGTEEKMSPGFHC